MKSLPSSANRTKSQARPATKAGLWLVGLSCLCLPVAVILYQVRAPSDGARISKEANSVENLGVYVHSYPGANSGLKDGDLVVAINGVMVESWVMNLFRRVSLRTGWEAGQPLTYQVLRNGRLLEIEIQFVSQPVGRIVIDRRFYRRRYQAEQILSAFSDRLREQVDLDELSAHVLAVVQETMQPEKVSLWLRDYEHRDYR